MTPPLCDRGTPPPQGGTEYEHFCASVKTGGNEANQPAHWAEGAEDAAQRGYAATRSLGARSGAVVVMAGALEDLVRQLRGHASQGQQRRLSSRHVRASRGAREHQGAKILALAEGVEHVHVRLIHTAFQSASRSIVASRSRSQSRFTISPKTRIPSKPAALAGPRTPETKEKNIDGTSPHQGIPAVDLDVLTAARQPAT
jgi:hypothetical protein